MAQLVKPNKNKHRFVVGIDFGHGETSAAISEIDWNATAGTTKHNYEDIVLDNMNGGKVLVSAIAQNSLGQYFKGEEVFRTNASSDLYFKGFEVKGIENVERSKYSSGQLEYIQEVFPLQNADLLVSRIDELSDYKPPKAIDSDRGIAELLAPIKPEINPLYLEVPHDFVQVEQISDAMMELEGLQHEAWILLSFDERMNILQKLENQVAAISHRPSCTLVAECLGVGHLGHYTVGSDQITLNSDYVKSELFVDYKEALDTLIHEGRHAYQDYNLHIREVHPRQGDISNWSLNEFSHGYQDVQHCGFKAYEMQPLESDARAFAEDVLKCYQEKIA